MVFAPLDMMSGTWVLKGHIFGETMLLYYLGVSWIVLVIC